ncbi:hypothetical protein DY000_02034707 [Brassica cretica]|uniref:Uncharacterized protein n=1 Tax=Brassica cretica TaxID=69181 RepID=A0ABQ7DG05_BRACR|nr:hypothetical protein DY000_02034707 [Brassica cretica]
MVRRKIPTTFRRHSDKKCNRCSRRKFVGIFRRNSDDIPINSKVVGIPSILEELGKAKRMKWYGRIESRGRVLSPEALTGREASSLGVEIEP